MAKNLIIDGNSIIEVEQTPEELLQRTIDEANHLKQLHDIKRNSISKIARTKILAIATEDQQRNMLARAIELIATQPQGLSEMLAELQVTWERIKAIRAHSNTLETSFDTSEDKLNFDIEAGWPE